VADKTKADATRIYFLRRLPRDPFFPDTSVPPAETWGQRSYASPPDAPSRGRDVFDVYSLSPATGLNGVPYREW
jgi:general secretion pathway protein G